MASSAKATPRRENCSESVGEVSRVFDLFGTAKSAYPFRCLYCKTEGLAKRRDRKYCSERCQKRAAAGLPKTRSCRQCGTAISILSGKDGNRRYCARACSRLAKRLQDAAFHVTNPGATSVYNARRSLRRPDENRDRKESDRRAVINALGGKCCACGVDNQLWLEVDYKATTRGKRHRHPRHRAYILTHLHEFRILCANHHRELTLTGRIVGTDIFQALAPLDRSTA